MRRTTPKAVKINVDVDNQGLAGITMSGTGQENNVPYSLAFQARNKPYENAIAIAGTALGGNQLGSTAPFVPPTRKVRTTFYNTDMVYMLSMVNSGIDSTGLSSIDFSVFKTLESFEVSGTVNTGVGLLKLPNSVKNIFVNANVNLVDLPALIERFVINSLYGGFSTLAAKLQKSRYLKAFLNGGFNNNITGGRSGASMINFATGSIGALDLSNTQLERLQYVGALTGLIIPLNNYYEFVLQNIGNTIPVSTLRTYINHALTCSNLTTFSFFGRDLSWSRPIGNTDVSNELRYFSISACSITGDVTITDPKPNLVIFHSFSASGSTFKNVHNTVNLSGATGLQTLSLNYCLTVNLILPAPGTLFSIYANGCKLSTSDFWNQILAHASYLQYLGLDAQDTTVGLGMTHVDLTLFSALLSVSLASNKIEEITLRASGGLNSLDVRGNADMHTINNLANQATTLNQLIYNNTALNVDLTTIPNAYVAGNFSAQTILDYRTRTATTSLQDVNFQNCPSLHSVYFNADSAKNVITNSITLNGCPLLSTMVNMDKIDFPPGSVHVFNVAGDSLNMIFPFGDNSFVPSSMAVHNNGMSQSNVDGTIDKLYSNRAKFSALGTVITVNISGTNAAPSGTYEAPTGFVLGVSDGSPVTARQKMYVLNNNYLFAITSN
ncbi:hypothetical protein [Chryseosolibacter indicus]|uniref:Uncharacterized protein n=1 Tax=Chryseosolibacter indicus TaxID=2782351 RepID=A0ABS5VNF5_9BACT|nr:hypothetical protein [Chryseosolibacter indicus]MBT1702970.1 hypothetical protein [Chryseosolibacter indicus]